MTAVFDDFFIRAMIAGIGVALLAAPLGCFVVWRRMAYFGETIAYSGLLGVALGFILGIDLTTGVFAVAIAAALLLAASQAAETRSRRTRCWASSPTSALAFGLIIASLKRVARGSI